MITTKKAGDSWDHLHRCNPASKRQILYVLSHTFGLPSNFHILVFMSEQIYIELRKLEDINGREKNDLNEYGSVGGVKPN